MSLKETMPSFAPPKKLNEQNPLYSKIEHFLPFLKRFLRGGKFSWLLMCYVVNIASYAAAT